MKNNDNRCFDWAILSAPFPKQHGQHADCPASYQANVGELNFTGIRFAVRVTNIIMFERQNSGLSVFGWKAGIYSLHVSKQEGRGIDLLLLTDPNDPEQTYYVWIKDLARMLHKNSKYDHRKHPCRRCLHVFSSETLLKNHRNDCQGTGEKPQRTEKPKEGKKHPKVHEPPQTDARAVHHLCRLRGTEHPHTRLCRQFRKKATHGRSQSRSHAATAM